MSCMCGNNRSHRRRHAPPERAESRHSSSDCFAAASKLHSRILANHSRSSPTNRSKGGRYGNHRDRNQEPQSRAARRVDRRAQGVSQEGKGIHAPARRDQPPAPRPALGKGREELRVRGPSRQCLALRSLRRPQPARHLSLHARPGMERRLPQLLLYLRPFRRHDHSPRQSRRHARSSFARADRRD